MDLTNEAHCLAFGRPTSSSRRAIELPEACFTFTSSTRTQLGQPSRDRLKVVI